MTLNEIWFILFVVIVGGYLILDGFDLPGPGAGLAWTIRRGSLLTEGSIMESYTLAVSAVPEPATGALMGLGLVLPVAYILLEKYL